MEIVLQVKGMMCTHCKASVEKALMAVPGTETAVVDLMAKTATATGSASREALAHAITEAGFEVVG